MEKITASLKLPVGVVKPVGDGFALSADGSDLAAKFVFWPPLLGGEVKEVVFFAVQYVEAFVELGAEFGV